MVNSPLIRPAISWGIPRGIGGTGTLRFPWQKQRKRWLNLVNVLDLPTGRKPQKRELCHLGFRNRLKHNIYELTTVIKKENQAEIHWWKKIIAKEEKKWFRIRTPSELQSTISHYFAWDFCWQPSGKTLPQLHVHLKKHYNSCDLTEVLMQRCQLPKNSNFLPATYDGNPTNMGHFERCVFPFQKG